MEQAIKKAIEGGWNDRLYRVDTGNTEVWTHHSSFLLDPRFWQALGKALGMDEGEFLAEGFARSSYHWMWHFQWHRFIDHLISGKDAESFFNELLK